MNDTHETRDQRIKRYLEYRYPVSLIELSEEDGGGFAASIPLLGGQTFVAVGDSQAEALNSLNDLREFLVPRMIEQGVELPVPALHEDLIENYSGVLNVRLTRSLHYQLAAQAKFNSTSINKLVVQYVAAGLTCSYAKEFFGTHMLPNDVPSAVHAANWDLEPQIMQGPGVSRSNQYAQTG